jgi:tetratricopeptide (TPR) repeat protein
MTDFRAHPEDVELRNKIIELAKTLKPAPVVPQVVRDDFAKAVAQLKNASTADDFKAVAMLFEQITAKAPWYADAYYNAAVAYAKAADYDSAKRNLTLYLAAARPDTNTQNAENLQRDLDRQQSELKRQQSLQQFQQALKEFSGNPNDAARERIIKLAQGMKPAPDVPDDAARSVARGRAALKDAKSTAAFKEVIAEFQKASLLAPWSADIYYNLGLVQDKAGNYAEALQNLKLYLLAAPDADDAKAVRNLIFEVEYRKDKAEMGQKLAEIIEEGFNGRDKRQEALALIDKGADVRVKNKSGAPVLERAACLGFTDVVRAMLDKGAEVESHDGSGWTPLICAAFNANLDTARLLIQRGANVNARDDNSSKTVLMHSVCNMFSAPPDRPLVVRLLIDSGANVNAKDNYGYTALAHAEGRSCTYPEIAQILRAAGTR